MSPKGNVKGKLRVSHLILDKDGKSYHRGLSGNAIAMKVRIPGVADACEALNAAHPSRAGIPPGRVISIVTGNSGTPLYLQVVEAFIQYQDQDQPLHFDRLEDKTT